VRRPSLAQLILWAFVALLVGCVALLAGLVGLGALVEPQATNVDPSTLPQGVRWYVVEGATGDVSLADCPALLGRSGPSPAWCAASDEITERVLLAAPVLAGVAGLAAFGCARRAWRCLRLRSAPAPPWPPASYRQEGMPWAFWLGIVLVGSFALLLDVIAVEHLLVGDIGSARGGLFWTAVLVLLVHRYGFRNAVALQTDGATLVWRAPMRTRRVPLNQVASYEIGGSALIGEHPARLRLADGSEIGVSVPNGAHAALLDGFLASFAPRSEGSAD
jgi:hypothetical protein